MPNQEFIALYLNAISIGYDKDLLEKLLNEISCYDEQNLYRYYVNKSRIRSYSAVVENSIGRTISELKNDFHNSQNSYYLTIKK